MGRVARAVRASASTRPSVGRQDSGIADRDEAERDDARDEGGARPRVGVGGFAANGRSCWHRIAVGRDDADDGHRIGEVLEAHRSPRSSYRTPSTRPREVGDLPRGEDLAGPRLPAQPRRQVQRTAPVPVVDAAPPRRRRARCPTGGELGLGERLLAEPPLEVGRRADRLARRGEHAECLVPAELEEYAAARSIDLAGDVGEPRRELPRRLVAVRLREERVPADVGDQERADLRAARCRSTAPGSVQVGHPSASSARRRVRARESRASRRQAASTRREPSDGIFGR